MTEQIAASKTKTRAGSTVRRFLRDSSGFSAIMTGIAVPIVLLAAGVAIDAGVISREQPIFYQAVDNAALAVAANEASVVPDNATAAQIAATKAAMRTYALKFIMANYHGIVTKASSFDLQIDLNGQRVNMDVKLKVPTTVSSLFGIEYTTLSAKTSIMRAMRPVELALVLDTTGSMKNDMVSLRNAANKLLSTLYSDPSATNRNMSSQFIRASLVPFSGAVRLDPTGPDFSMNWIDTTGQNSLSRINFNDPTWNNFTAWSKLKVNATTPQTWNGCVEARKANVNGTNYITQDIAPLLTDGETKFPAYFSPDSPSWYTQSSSNAGRWNNASGSLQNAANWNNEYIYPAYDYSSSSSGPNVLAPSGSQKTGYDDSTIGRSNTNFATRFTNTWKYENKIIGAEKFTLAGDSVTWSSNAGPWRNCTASRVVSMTHDRARIEAGINNMLAYGGTNIAEGLAWGMRTLSPTAPFMIAQGVGAIPSEAISPYNGPRWQKILVLMTDGENDPYVRYSNGSVATLQDTGTSYNAFGFSNTTTTGGLNRYESTTLTAAGPKLDTYTLAMCTQLKANGVTIYTVGFRVDNAMMKSCATSAAHYKYVNSDLELVTYFDSIGKDVLNKMVYVAN